MLVLRHSHNRSNAAEAKKIVRKMLSDKGCSAHVKWDGNSFSSTVGYGFALKVKGEITDKELIINHASGVMGGVVVDKCRAMLNCI